ncbi:MAG: hypothetical protein GY866_39875, partial [Proteobacteria bacterium]|nr:hypothetical protein [Pseudomonadota bacterium]
MSAKIEESEIVLDESGSIPIQESRSGLNLFQLLMLAAAPLSNSSDETLRREVLIVFEHLETLVRTLNRLIRFDCHDRVSWVKSRHNETNRFYLRVIDMPLFELLRLQDENDLGDPAEPTVALYRKLFAGGRPTTVYIPWGYSYPALEKVLSKLPPLDSTFLIDPGDFVTMPDESRYTRLYDDESRLTAEIDTQEANVSICPEWPEFTVPIELRKKRPFDKETHDKSALWLLDANQLEALEKKLAHTSESDLLSLDAAVFSSNDQVRLAVRCRTNIDRHKAFFTGMTECYREWLSGQGTSILFLPSGYELYPSLRRETYLKALGIAGLVDDTAVFIPNAQGPPMLLHFPNSMFQSMRRTLVDYRITVNKQEIEKIIDASILDYDDFEIIAGDTQKENNLRDPETRRGRKKAAKQEAVSTSADGTAGRSSPKNSGPVQPKVIGYQEMKSIVRKARDIRYRNYTIPFDEMLSKREWQKLNQATGVHSAKTMDLIPSGLSNLLRENYLGIPQLLLQHRSHKQKQTTIEKLNAIFTDALGILPNSNTLKTSLVKLFGPTGIKITRSSITIQPPPSEDGKD